MKKYKIRHKIIAIIFIFFALTFIIKLFYIQVINDNYKFSANNNVLRYEVQEAVRGLIYDRNNKLIVANVPAYDLMIIPREVKSSFIDTNLFCQLTDISKNKFIEKLEKAKKYSKYKESVFIKNIDLKNSSKLAENLFDFPGFFLRKITMRKYSENTAAHLIGYLGEVNDRQTKKDKYYTKGDLTGKTGIEAAYEKELRGEKGMTIKLVDVHNREKGKFQEGKYDTLSVPGKNLISTIDIELQKYGEKLLKNKIGSIVAIEPNSGEILCLISAPSYNLNHLSGRKRSLNYKDLSVDPSKPLFNRSLQGAYPPGSIFKLVNGLIALQEGIIDENHKIKCTNGYEYDKNKTIGCHPYNQPINLKKAIEISCNTYFCNLFDQYFKKYNNKSTAYNSWYSHVRSFGIGDYLNNDFISGNPGKLPQQKYYDDLYKKSWNANTIISMAIGQGELLLTPIQMANMTAIIANRGHYYTPHIIKKIDGQEIDSTFKIKRYSSINTVFFEPIIEGMEKVVSGKDGTAKNASIKNISICGKTGTAQNPHGDDHSIFIAFAPKNNPKIAIAIYVENGGWGSKWAAPIGSLMIEKYLSNEIQNKELEKIMLEGFLIDKR